MKNLRNLFLFMLTVSVTLFTSCSSSDDGGSGGSAASGTIKAKIDGSNFTSLEITSFASVQTGGGVTTLVMQGNTQDQAINMIINGYEGVGTYQISDSNVFITASYIEPDISNPANSQTWSAPFQDSGIIGEIKVSEETSSKIKGTFYYTAKNSNTGGTKEITEGSFNLNKM